MSATETNVTKTPDEKTSRLVDEVIAIANAVNDHAPPGYFPLVFDAVMKVFYRNRYNEEYPCSVV